MTDLTSLQSLIDHQDGFNEIACQEFLKQAAPFLVPRTPDRLLHCGREQQSRSGRADFVVSAEYGSGPAAERHAYVWEVKAPQCHLFERDDSAQRLRPTRDLIKAETQLAHYVLELRRSPSFRNLFQLDELSRVIPAGIIIGRSHRLGARRASAGDAEQASSERIALHARRSLLYRPAQIVIHTWDDVARFLDSGTSFYALE